ncbi:hypothetical protein MKZ38_006714 [Zalerion maritima]|uniref:U3 small nucleolar RNA-associated protein 22 n=1 Tax=Zalerion maritima TaxID=339359 RepID=A0AAD5RJN4_9PEZI|nr:hypothetical protein MKZ38_006714 [Zalerion maritima]
MESSPKRRKLDHAGAIATSIELGVHRHNTFVLETQELLKEIRPNYKEKFPDAEDALRRVKKAAEAIEPHDAIPMGEAIAQFERTHKIAIPFPHPKPSRPSNYKFSLAKPAKVNVVGSYVLQTMVKSDSACAVDMVVVMPESLFQEKDYLNLRYFYKRAYFLASLTAAVREELGGGMTFEFEHLGDNGLLPVLVLKTKGAKKTGNHEGDGQSVKKKRKSGGYAIRVIPCAPPDLFSKTKLLPTSNGIRPANSTSGKEDLTATPFYNSTIAAEMSYLAYLNLLHRVCEQCAGFKDACMLGRIWLQQRGIGGRISQGGFGHFEFAAIAALLLRPGSGRKGEPALSSSLGSTQIFKAVLRFLSVTDFANKPCVFGSKKGESTEAVPKEGPAIFDSERRHNVAYKMAPWSVALLRQHAKWSSVLFADDRADQFTPMFIVKADLPQQMYDLMVTIPHNSIQPSKSLDKKGDSWTFQEKLYKVLARALGDRIQLIHIESEADLKWKVSAHAPAETANDILVGIVFDDRNMARKMDKGPDAEDKPNSAEFRRFWGDKSELRRFQDGSMTENVIWTQGTPFAVCEEIVRYILGLHFNLGPHDMEFSGGELPSIIHASAADGPAFIATRKQFDGFERDIRNLEKLPLHVRLVSPTAPELRYSSLRLPPSRYDKDPSRVLDVVISFEASSKWPDNLAAIQRAKIAFLARIGTLLEEDQKDATVIKTRIGLEDSRREIENLAYLDVTYDRAITFRLRIHSDLEEAILERRTKDKLLDQQAKTESADLLSRLRRDCTTLPLHTQTISRFCTKFPSLSPTIRLLKLWFSRHKLSAHFSAEVIELLACHTFLEPYPWNTPSSASTGVLRTLQFLARWDWRDEPLVVDFTGEMTTAEQGQIEMRLEAWRKIDPNMGRVAMFVATSTDASGTGFTAGGGGNSGGARPSKVVAARMTALARSACKLVRNAAPGGETPGFLDTEALFKSSTREFDIVLRLSSKSIRSIICGEDSATARKRRSGSSKFKNLSLGGTASALVERTISSTSAPSIPNHPARMFVDILNQVYGDVIVFFQGEESDGADGDAAAPTILGVWNQQIRARSFRVNLPCSFKPVGKGSSGEDDSDDDDDDLVEVNRMGILAEIARIGGEMVEKIEVNSE